MKIRRSTMAIVAAGAIVLAGCTADNGGDDDPGTEEPGSEGTGEEPSGDPTGDTPAADTAKPDLGEVTTNDDEIIFSSGQDEWSGYNGSLTSTNSTYNAAINGRLQGSFWYYGTDGTITPDENWGTYEVTSEDPLTVEYTIADDAVWEDGTPITYDDYYLDWVMNNPVSVFGEPAEGEAPLFNYVTSSFGEYVPEGPVGEWGEKTFEVVYPEPYPDYQLVVGPVFPSHVLLEQGGVTIEDVAAAVEAGDNSSLQDVADYFNTGWLSNSGELPDATTVPSSAEYSLDGATWVAGQSLNLVANENYWGPPAATGNLTFAFADPSTYTQALENGDINVIDPQATVDTVNDLEALGDMVTVETSEDLTWEHLDYNFAEGGDDRPASPFADTEGGLAAREAFAMCVPRQAIVDNLIVPIFEDAEVMNAREVFPFQEDYDEVVEASYDGRYDEVDLEGAQAKFEESGLEEGTVVRIGYSAPNPRRTDEVVLIKESCDQVGFEIQDTGAANFFQEGGDLETGNWEIALFAWAGSGQIASGQTIYQTNGTQNQGQYSSEVVDEAWSTLASSLDPEVHLEQIKIIETELWNDLYGIPLFAHPGIAAYDSTISNVIPNSSQTGVVWNAEQWVRSE